MVNTTAEIIQTLERLKMEIEWDHSLEYQIALDKTIKILKMVEGFTDGKQQGQE